MENSPSGHWGPLNSWQDYESIGNWITVTEEEEEDEEQDQEEWKNDGWRPLTPSLSLEIKNSLKRKKIHTHVGKTTGIT